MDCPFDIIVGHTGQAVRHDPPKLIEEKCRSTAASGRRVRWLVSGLLHHFLVVASKYKEQLVEHCYVGFFPDDEGCSCTVGYGSEPHHERRILTAEVRGMFVETLEALPQRCEDDARIHSLVSPHNGRLRPCTEVIEGARICESLVPSAGALELDNPTKAVGV